MPNTQLLTLQSNGASNNGVFIDNSRFNNIITRNGNVNNGTFSPYGDNWSCFFNGTSAVQTPASSITNIIGTNGLTSTATFTIECWIYQTQRQTYASFPCMMGDMAPSGAFCNFSFGPSSTGQLQFFWWDGTMRYATGGSTIPLNTWTHVAVSISSGSIKLFVNGNLETITGTSTTTNASSTQGYFAVGMEYYGTATNGYFGYISNLRIVKSALYSSNFTPSSTPLLPQANTSLLTFQSNRFIDNSTNNYALTLTSTPTVQKFSPFSTVTVPKYYSTYFNGTTDYINITPNLNLESAAFTVECWVSPTTAVTGVQQAICSQYYNAGTNPRWGIAINTTGQFECFLNGMPEGNLTITHSATITSMNWYHVAVTRDSSNNFTMWVNGVPSTSYTRTGSMASSAIPFSLGCINSSNINLFGGRISNFRIIKGQALVTGAFTPSTSPLTVNTPGHTGDNVAASITGTVILMTCQNNTFIDNSTNNSSITPATTTVKPLQVSPFTPTANTGLTYSPTTFGGSMYFDGTGDYLSYVPPASNFLSNNKWTVDFWIYQTGAGDATNGTGYAFYGNTGSDYYRTQFAVGSNGANPYLFIEGSSGATQQAVTSSTTYTLNAWHHLAYVADGSNYKIYLDGIQIASAAISVASTITTNIFYVGLYRSSAALWYFPGYISDFRITPGAALYTSNFYPGSSPATPITFTNNRTDLANTAQATLLLNGTSTGIIDQTRSVNLETFGDAKVVQGVSPYSGSYYSNYFDGNNDYLTTPSNAAFTLGTGDFTIECWFNRTGANSGSMSLFDLRTAEPSIAPNLFVNGSGGASPLQLEYWVNGASRILAPTAPDANTWYHVAVVRSSGTTKMYLNGTQVGSSYTDSNDYVGTITIVGGRFAAVTGDYRAWFGYISNARIVKGSAVYTSDFTPSTTPLTAVSGTVLLTCQDSTFKDNSTNNFTVTKSGNVAVKPQNPFQVNSGQSYYFDGTGDYLSITKPNSLQVGSGPFTFECWFYKTVSTGATEQSILGATTNGSLTIDLGQSGVWVGRNSVAFIMQPGYTEQIGQWVHLAVTRGSSSDYRVFINGTQIGTTIIDSNSLPDTAGWIIGNNGSIARPFNGYITDLRITKGISRYSSNNTTYLNSGSPYMTK